jgi:hypothetical protein
MKDAAGKLQLLLAEEMSRQTGAYIERDGRTNLLGQCRGGLAQIPVAAMGIDGSEQEDRRLEHHVDLDRTHYAGTRARYRVTYLGKTLIESTRDPEFDACRALAAKGITGILVTYNLGSSVPRLRVDIAKGAQLMTIDNASDGPRIGRYRPHPKSGGEDDAD